MKTFIIHRQNQRSWSLDANALERNLLSYMNKYSLYSPYFMYKHQVIFLDTIGLNYLHNPFNFDAFGQKYIIVFFTHSNVNIGQYFSQDQKVDQSHIYFNALNNYSVDFLYTNISYGVRNDRNVIEEIYSIAGIPLSFVNTNEYRYSYEGKRPINWCRTSDDFRGGTNVPIKLKNEPDGTLYMDGVNWQGPLIPMRNIFGNAFDKLLIYQLKQSRCHYLLASTILNLEVYDLAPTQFLESVISLNDAQTRARDVEELEDRKEPFLFDLPIHYNRPYITAMDLPGGDIANEAKFAHTIALCSDIHQLINKNAEYSFYNFDVILAANTPLYGNKTIRYKTKDYAAIWGRGFQMTPYQILSYSNLLLNTTSNGEGLFESRANSAVYVFTLKPSTTDDIDFVHRNINYMHITNQKNWPNRYYNYNIATKKWSGSFGVTEGFNNYGDVTIFVWDNSNIMDEFDLPPTGWNVYNIIKKPNSDYMTPTNYLYTYLKNIDPWGPINSLDYTASEYFSNSLFAFRSAIPDNFAIYPSSNLSTFIDQKLELAFYDFDRVLNIYEINGIPPNFFQVDYISGAPDIALRSAHPMSLNARLFQNANGEWKNYPTQTIDEIPFVEGVRIMRQYFDYKNYFQMRHFPIFTVRKTFKLDEDLDFYDKEQGLLVTKEFQINSLLFNDFSLMSCFILPDYSLNYSDTSNSGKKFGLAIKCSMTATNRTEKNYLFFEQGGKIQLNWEEFRLGDLFTFAVFFPPNTDYEYNNTNITNTLARTNDPGWFKSTKMTIYMLFK